MKWVISILVFVSIFLSSSIFAKEPTNLAIVKQGLERYHDSGQYERDITVVVNHAVQYLSYRLVHEPNPKLKPAIVLDIDETSLSNYPNLVKLDFGGTKDEIHGAENEGLDPVIKPTLKLYRFAKAHNISVFFITGRHEDERAATERNLKAAGYQNWNGLTFRSDEYKLALASVYKTEMRKQLTEKGYDILMNLGDQESDLGNYADKNFKLPNPYYLIK